MKKLKQWINNRILIRKPIIFDIKKGKSVRRIGAFCPIFRIAKPCVISSENIEHVKIDPKPVSFDDAWNEVGLFDWDKALAEVEAL